MFSFLLSQQKYFYNKQTEMRVMYMYGTKYDMHYMYLDHGKSAYKQFI